MALANFGLDYSARQRGAVTSRDAALARNAYSRFLAQQRGGRQAVDLNKKMTEGVGQMAAGYGRRGLRHSGIFQNAQSQYAQQWTQGQQDINDELAAALRQADFADSQAWNDYHQTEADIEAQKAADILAAAAQLKALLGG